MRKFLSTWKAPGKVAIEGALKASASNGSLLDCLELGLAAAEDDPDLASIGRGSFPNSDGDLELDASVMLGRDLSAGAICAMRGILPAISVARRVMEKTPHLMLAGDQARRFAIENGFVPQNLMTEAICNHYKLYLRSPERAKAYVHTVPQEPQHDTVTMLAYEDGTTVAASSTSGISYKMPGRVGDSPIVGAGIYADDEAGCAGATGLGEELWKACASFRATEAMRSGASAQEACDAVVRQMLRRQPGTHEHSCVVLAIDLNGNHGAAITHGEFDLWIAEDDKLTCEHFEALTP